MTNYILILLSCLVIFSYTFDYFSRKTRVPSVILLLATGFALQQFTVFFKIPFIDFDIVLPTLGTIGLIMIVFEGALELHFEKGKTKLIINSFFSAFVNLLLSTIVIAMIIQYYSGESIMLCLLNAVPLSVVSSAIAIPSVSSIDPAKKEFIVYESTFSDILGIIFFNFFLVHEQVNLQSFVQTGGEIIFTMFISAFFSLLFLYIMGNISHTVKFFLIISMLVLVYTSGKLFHLSSLIIVLVFGLFLNNAHKIHFKWFSKYFLYDHYKSDLNQLYQLSAESAFLVRTFFFIIFGFLINTDNLTNIDNLSLAGLMVVFIFIFRIIYSFLTTRTMQIPEVFINPRGLISILLFLSIPAERMSVLVNNSLLIIIILITSIIMTFGLIFSGKKNELK